MSAVDASAAEWAVRLDRAPLDDEARAELDAWLADDPRHRGALLRAQAAWATLVPDPLPAEEPRAPDRRRWLAGAMRGAALTAVAAVGAFLWWQPGEDDVVATLRGEQRRARLADGSTMLLNTDSRSRVAYTAERRQVTLDRGEAWFEVAKDRARPFVVEVGAVRVEAVGTAFAVRRIAGRAEVAVTEGRVRIWSLADPARFLFLDAGRRASVAEEAGAGAAVVRDGGVADALAWRRGEIVLDGMTLGDAAAEFNRYNDRQLAVEAALAERRIVGWFRTRDVEGFARSAAAMTGARIEQHAEAIRIVQ
ncbi:FecR family protein [Sphingomonas rubra]|uniref:FecR family protein n=1 Tax=Sphingomonas rubra TaxID=634430 RepID=A0A1I5RFH7_9SPHN|nr:FecR domain-containing protein [Sphingomonas rubra]SFP57283.1 FecR family protein [Sphingomonas rubra]